MRPAPRHMRIASKVLRSAYDRAINATVKIAPIREMLGHSSFPRSNSSATTAETWFS